MSTIFNFKTQQEINNLLNKICDKKIDDIKITRTCYKIVQSDHVNEHGFHEFYSEIDTQEIKYISCKEFYVKIMHQKDLLPTNIIKLKIITNTYLNQSKLVEKENIINLFKTMNLFQNKHGHVTVKELSKSNDLEYYICKDGHNVLNNHPEILYWVISILGLNIFYRIWNNNKFQYSEIVIQINKIIF